jgi:16S rRNA (guanine966-N2)-methyltransferase
MRVVAGEFRGRRLVAPEGDTTRPTTDMVREAMFNSLASMGIVDGAEVIDLFAGSGALGIEALSRGAAHCTFVERDRAALTALRANHDTLGLRDRATVAQSDAVAWSAAPRQADLALIDPPYSFDGWAELLANVQAAYAACEAAREVPAPAGWTSLRVRRYGRTTVTLLSRDTPDD